MAATSAVLKRASVRTFTDEPLTEEDIRALLVAAMAAPSAHNQQPWEFYVVRDRALLEKLSKVSPYTGPAGRGACAIVPCLRTGGLKSEAHAVQDISASVENILVEAAGRGLGTVWMGICPEEERMAAVADLLDIPATLRPFAIIACGHPDAPVEARGPERYDEARVHWA